MTMKPRKTTAPDACPTSLQVFLAELDHLQGDPATKAGVLGILRRMTGQRLHLTRRDLARPGELAQARQLLTTCASATEARAALVRRYGFSRDTAERLVTAALAAPLPPSLPGRDAGIHDPRRP